MKKRLLHLALVAAGALASLYALYFIAEQFSFVTLPKEGEAPLLYANQARSDLTRTYLKAIESAKERILLLIYNLSDPAITSALRKGAEGGIDITVVCDNKASRDAKRYLGSKVKVYKRGGKGLMHIKALAVDGELLLIGSANLSRQSLRMHGNLLVAFRDRGMARFVEERALDIAAGRPSKGPSSKVATVGGEVVELFFLPDEKRAKERIIELIDGAEKTIKVAMFTWTRRDFTEALLRSRLRGVKVEPLIDRSAAYSSSKKIARLLYREKIPLRVNSDQGLLHHKFLLIDDKTLVNGSANWTRAAFRENQDCFIVLHDLNEGQRALLESMWKAIANDSTPYKP